MFEINEYTNLIRLTKGDTAPIHVEIRNNRDDIIEMEPGDILVFTVKKTAERRSPILLQVISDSPDFDLPSEKTAKLPVGHLSYDLEFRPNGGTDRFTLIGANTSSVHLNNFIVLPEVTIGGS